MSFLLFWVFKNFAAVKHANIENNQFCFFEITIINTKNEDININQRMGS